MDVLRRLREVRNVIDLIGDQAVGSAVRTLIAATDLINQKVVNDELVVAADRRAVEAGAAELLAAVRRTLTLDTPRGRRSRPQR